MHLRPLPVLSFLTRPSPETTLPQDPAVQDQQRSASGDNTSKAQAYKPQTLHGRVTESLLRMEANGSVFDKRDTDLLDIREVSAEDRQSYLAILKRPREEGAFNNPAAFLNSLSSDETGVLQRIHSLASPHSVKKTSVEGAINVLLPPGSAVDLNNDSFVETGASKGFRFPPPNAPDEVHKAWEDATSGLSPEDKLRAQLPFVSVALSASIRINDAGEFVRMVEPGSPEYKNPFPQDLEAWSKFTFDKVEEYRVGAELDPAMTVVADQLEVFRASLDGLLDKQS